MATPHREEKRVSEPDRREQDRAADLVRRYPTARERHGMIVNAIMDLGRLASGPGSSPFGTEAVSHLRPSGDDPLRGDGL